MNDRPPSAAASIYPHLKLAERPIQRPSSVSVAAAMFPSLVPKPPSDPYRESYLRHMKAMGLIPIEQET
jgi:hypothetical protein